MLCAWPELQIVLGTCERAVKDSCMPCPCLQCMERNGMPSIKVSCPHMRFCGHKESQVIEGIVRLGLASTVKGHQPVCAGFKAKDKANVLKGSHIGKPIVAQVAELTQTPASVNQVGRNRETQPLSGLFFKGRREKKADTTSSARRVGAGFQGKHHKKAT